MIEAKYGEHIDYIKNPLIKFPDFILQYTGTTSVVPDFNKNLNMITIHFLVKLSGTSEEITWNSGTGDIGPTEFRTIRNKRFLLYLGRDKNNRSLSDNELIIEKRAL